MTLKFLLALAAVAAAQTTTVSVFPSLGNDLVATVIDVDGATTTLGISCREGATPDECALRLQSPDFFTHVGSPSTISYFFEDKIKDGYAEAICDLDGDSAECRGTVAVGDFTRVDEDTIQDYKTWMVDVTVTAGAEKLSAAADTPTETSGDKPKETGAKDGEEEEEEDESGAVGMAGSSLLVAAVAVGAVLV